MCERINSEIPFSLRCVLDQYKTQKMCNKAVHDCLAALKLAPDWFVTRKMIKKIFTVLYVDENILYFNGDSSNVVFNYNETSIRNIDLNCIKLGDNNFDKDDPEIIIMSDFWQGISNLKKRKAFKKELNKELMPVGWHPNRWWDWRMSQNEKRETDPMFIRVIK